MVSQETGLTIYSSYSFTARGAPLTKIQCTGRMENLTLEYLHMSTISPPVQISTLDMQASNYHLAVHFLSCPCPKQA